VTVTPSGRFPSVLSRPDCSFNAGMSAFAIARHAHQVVQAVVPRRETVVPSARQAMQSSCVNGRSARALTKLTYVGSQSKANSDVHGRQVADRSRIAEVRSASHCCEVMTMRAADLYPWRRLDYWSPLVFLNHTNA